MHLLLMCVSLVILIVSSVYGLINITSKPAKVANGDFVKLICDVGTMEKTVAWDYDAVTYFSCNSPYTNCFTNTRIRNSGYYQFSINDDSLNVVLPVLKNQTDGVWSCYHGDEKADFEIDNAEAAVITRLYPTLINKPAETDILCNVQSEIPVDVLIYAVGYKGKRIFYDVKQSNQSQHTVPATLLCSDTLIYCNVTNGYGSTASFYGNVYLECPLKILKNFPYNTTMTFMDRTSSGDIKIYYQGYPPPSSSIHRIGAVDIPEVNKYYGGIKASVRYLTQTEPAYINVYISDFDIVKAGKYILTLKQNNITEIVYIDLIDLTTTTTVLPTTTIDTKITSNRVEDTNSKKGMKTTPRPVKRISDGNFASKTCHETKIILTGFVISLLLKF